MKALDKGAKMTYIDPRFSITASKAHRYWMIRPGTDLALNYALMHVNSQRRALRQGLCRPLDQGSTPGIAGLTEIRRIIHAGNGLKKKRAYLRRRNYDLAREVAADKPAVVFHYG